MSTKVDHNLISDLEHFGLKDAKMCYNCGNCTGVCPLSTGDNTFPRRIMRYAQLGLKEKIMQSPEPWLCYYCGTCSVKCPRGADPGEAMMAMRRYLTSEYDWTGFARKFYTSETFEFLAIAIVALLVGLGLLLFNTGTPNWEHAYINSVWPAEDIEIADLVMAAILTTFLLSNVFRCFMFIMGDLKFKVPIRYYIGEMKDLLIHYVTQKRFGKCEDRTQWFIHLLIMTGYSTAFLLVVVGIRWFQRDVEYESVFHPVRLLGYYATAAILYGTTYAIIGRVKKSKPPYKNSHSTDWMFLALLWLTTFTGIVVHFTRLLDWPMATYVIYVLHLMIAVPMLVLEVPFAKWAHLAYRPVAIYLLQVRAKYLAENQQVQQVEEQVLASQEA